jgi:hypothetical protein
MLIGRSAAFDQQLAQIATSIDKTVLEGNVLAECEILPGLPGYQISLIV